jgi:hypothetical protein
MLPAAPCDSLHRARLCLLAPSVVIRRRHVHSAMRVAGRCEVGSKETGRDDEWISCLARLIADTGTRSYQLGRSARIAHEDEAGTTDEDEYVREGSDWRPSFIERRRVSFPRSRNPSRIAPLRSFPGLGAY